MPEGALPIYPVEVEVDAQLVCEKGHQYPANRLGISGCPFCKLSNQIARKKVSEMLFKDGQKPTEEEIDAAIKLFSNLSKS